MISHSRYVAAHGCPRAIWQGRHSPSRPRPPLDRHQLAGLVAHRAVELAVAAGWPESGWETSYADGWATAAQEFEVPDWQRLPAAPMAFVTLRRWLVEQAPSTRTAHAEVELGTADGVVQGRADLLVEGDAGVGLLDVKTGRAAERALEGGVLRQLDLYAAVLEEGGRAVDWLGLLSSMGQHETVPHDRTRSRAVLEEVRAAGLAADVPTAPAGTPEPSACFGCRWLDGCDEGAGALDSGTQLVLVLRLDQSAVGPSAIVESVETGDVRRVDLVEHPAASPEGEVRLVELEDQHRLVGRS